MSDGQKKLLLGAIIVIALGAVAFMANTMLAPEKEQVVGTLPMPEGGGRDAEKGSPTAGGGGGGGAGGKEAGADPSGMPSNLR